jgi:hypothetical protein
MIFGKARSTGSIPAEAVGAEGLCRGDWFDQARVIVVDVTDPHAHRPASHRL